MNPANKNNLKTRNVQWLFRLNQLVTNNSDKLAEGNNDSEVGDAEMKDGESLYTENSILDSDSKPIGFNEEVVNRLGLHK
jgi:hypothetical protein